MPTSSTHIEQIAYDFWENSFVSTSYPVTISLLEQAICLSLPLSIVKLDKLCLHRISGWLKSRRLNIPDSLEEKRLYGLLFINKGNGFIFLNGTETLEEQCFTLAHELSHYLLDFDLPRRTAIAQLGKTITEVLDGKRMPTIEEQLHGIIKGLFVHPYVHLLDSPLSNAYERMNIWKVEENADQLALELLAPFTAIKKDIQTIGVNIQYNDLIDCLPSLLTEKYKLPSTVAIVYARNLAYIMTGGPTLAEQWGINF